LADRSAQSPDWNGKMNEEVMNSFTREYREKNWGLRIEDGSISVQTRFTNKTIALSDVDKVVWFSFSRVQIHSRKQIIVFFCLQISDIPLRNEMMLFLRNTIPHEKQFGWKNLCDWIDKQPKRWLPKEKPSKREPDPTKGECLLTRKQCDKWIPWLIVSTILVMTGTPWLYNYLSKAFPVEFAPVHNPFTLFILPAIFCLCLWGMWFLLWLRVPKTGMIATKFSKDKEGKLLVVVMIIAFLLPLGVGLFEKHFSPKANAIFGMILFSSIIVASLFFVIRYGIADYRMFKQRMAEMPDDYIPEILTRHMVDEDSNRVTE